MIKVGINGFGRIGRLAARIIMEKYPDKLVLSLINTSGKIDPAGWTHLLKYDSTYRKFNKDLQKTTDGFICNDQTIPITSEKDPSKIPWEKYNTEIVIESTGKFFKKDEVSCHLRGTVRKVVLAAPPKDDTIPMFVIGLNTEELINENIFSCASCTTNCVGPVTKVMDSNFGIQKALLTTVHAYTPDQELLDGSHKDLRRARAAALNIVPTSTGAAKSLGKVYPNVSEIFDGLAIRVPVATGSLTDFTFLLKRPVTPEEVNNAFKKAAQDDLKGILAVTEEPIVSSDIIGQEFSAIVDLSLTNVVAGDLVKVIAWYDNEWGYANRLVEEAILAGRN